MGADSTFHRWRLAVCAGFCVLSIALQTRAALVAMNYQGVPLAVDTVTGFGWLSPSQTLGLSPATALANHPGYQLATLSQVEGLLQDVGIPPADLPNGSISDPTPGDYLASTFGYGQDVWVQYYGAAASGWEYTSYGYLLDPSGVGADQEFIDTRNPPLGSDGTYTSYAAPNDNLAVSDSSNFDFLVTTSVPEPAAGIALLLLTTLMIVPRPRRVRGGG
jgi:hypothetical protein